MSTSYGNLFKFRRIVESLRERGLIEVGMETLKAEVIIQGDILSEPAIKRVINAMTLTGFLKLNGMRFELCTERGKFPSDDVEKVEAEADRLLEKFGEL